MGRIKILHIIGGGEYGGAEEHLLTLFRHLDSSTFELHAACLFREPLAPLIVAEGFPAHVFPMQNKFDIKPVGDIASLIRAEGFHIIHTHGVRANLIGRLAAGRAGTKNVVTTVHSVLSFDYSRRLDRWVNRLCEEWTRGKTARFIAISGMLARQLKSEGIPGAKITVVHNGLELQKYKPEISGLPVRKEFGITADRVVMGIVARLHPVKGHSCLIEALAAVVGQLPGLMLLIVGTGPDRDKLEKLVRNLNLDKNVIFTGFRKDIPQVLAALDFLVAPSVSEGLGLTVMEGMAMQKPVVAFGVGGIPEIITSGADGLLVPPQDAAALAAAIAELAGDRERVRLLGEAARKTVEQRFSAENMARATGLVYQELIGDVI